MFCKNRITLIGHLGKDAEARFTTKGTACSRFSIATTSAGRIRIPANTGAGRSGTRACFGRSWPGGQPACRKALLSKSRANSGTASTSRKTPTQSPPPKIHMTSLRRP
jgi:hypothetical protein